MPEQEELPEMYDLERKRVRAEVDAMRLAQQNLAEDEAEGDD